MKFTCIMCPIGCALSVEEDKGQMKVSGNGCKKGEQYGKQEFTSPKRFVTSLIITKNDRIISCKTNNEVPKSKIFDVLNEIKTIMVDCKVCIGDILIHDVCGIIGVDIVVTRG